MIYHELATLAEREYADIILEAEVRPDRLRLHVIDASYIDVWFSSKIPGRFAYHWERRFLDGTIYRYDNRPHREYKYLQSYPRHFHQGKVVTESSFSLEPSRALSEFLDFVRSKLNMQNSKI
ncbi:toxin-antitoxin system TumE family protein [Neomoorella carbonis]|uniref:toxin-antitoxin system TumE family protein n=1 Tax=Neomoorella carbonis TaxID=3062783 RepID=UPI003256555F